MYSLNSLGSQAFSFRASCPRTTYKTFNMTPARGRLYQLFFLQKSAQERCRSALRLDCTLSVVAYCWQKWLTQLTKTSSQFKTVSSGDYWPGKCVAVPKTCTDWIRPCLSLSPEIDFSRVACLRRRNCLSNFLTLGRKEIRGKKKNKHNYTSTGLLTFKKRQWWA